MAGGHWVVSNLHIYVHILILLFFNETGVEMLQGIVIIIIIFLLFFFYFFLKEKKKTRIKTHRLYLTAYDCVFGVLYVNQKESFS